MQPCLEKSPICTFSLLVVPIFFLDTKAMDHSGQKVFKLATEVYQTELVPVQHLPSLIHLKPFGKCHQ